MIADWSAEDREAAMSEPRQSMHKLADGERRLVLDWPEDQDFVAYGLPDKDGDSGFVSLLATAGSDRVAETNVDPARGIDLDLLAAETGGSVSAGAGAPSDLAYSELGSAVSLKRIWPLFVLFALLFFLGDVFWRRRPNRPVAE